jgi:hypothetical protein
MDRILRKGSFAENDDRRLSPVEINEDVCSVLFNSINVRQFHFLSLWKITCEYYTKFRNVWCFRTSIYSALCEDGE